MNHFHGDSRNYLRSVSDVEFLMRQINAMCRKMCKFLVCDVCQNSIFT